MIHNLEAGRVLLLVVFVFRIPLFLPLVILFFLALYIGISIFDIFIPFYSFYFYVLSTF